MVSIKAPNFSFKGFCFVFILMHVSALPSSTTADGTVLHVLVPIRSDFMEFVDCGDGSNVKGFCIDVFKSALSILIPKPSWTAVNYSCYKIGNDSYDAMIDHLGERNKDIDAVVGDVTISAARLVNASFTQNYLDSGIVIVTPDEGVSQSFLGVFFAPFTLETWGFMFGSIFLTGSTLWLLEHNEHQALQGAPSSSEQFKSMFWFVTSILIFFKRDSIKNPLAKFVMMAWILFILLLGSSYTASLSSILTVNELSQKSLTLKDLSNMNKTVGYQVGSVVKDYLEGHNIRNLKPLYNMTEYAYALRSKDVVAVVEEIPYISLFLAAQSASNCRFSVSQKLTIEGWGFAFRDRSLSAAFSIAILNLSESGQMQTIQDGWKLSNFQCPSRIQSTRLDLRNSEGLFVFLGAGMFVCIGIFLLKHKIGPYSVQSYVRFRANERRDAIESFREPNLIVSIRRSSARHNLAPEELT